MNAVADTCQAVSSFLKENPGNYLGALGAAFKFANSSKPQDCILFDEQYTVLGDPTNDPTFASYSYQCCAQGTVVSSEFSSDGAPGSVLPPINITSELIRTECLEAYGPTVPQPTPADVAVNFMENLKKIGRIVFTNGEMDGWSGGGMLEPLPGVEMAVIVYKNASHCTDTHSFNWNNTAEPPEYKLQRAEAMDAAAAWMEEHRAARSDVYLVNSVGDY